MRKENLVSANVRNICGRITRTQAAALCTTTQTHPSKSFALQDQKRVNRTKRKQDVNKNSSNVPCIPSLLRRKRAALMEITNICCESSYKSCFTSAKIQAKKSKQAKKGHVNVSKVVPTAIIESPDHQDDSKSKTFEEKLVAESRSEMMISSVSVEVNLTIQKCPVKSGVHDDWVSELSSGVPSGLQSQSPKGKNNNFSRGLTEPSDLDYINIDSDDKDPQICSIYAPDIYQNLLVAELARRPCSDFLETSQQDISQSMRGILVDWLVEVSEEYNLVPDTLYLTVHLIDRFLSQNYIERQRLQLLGITCMLIASKYEEICAPRVEEFCFITDNTYTREEVLKMESQVLKYFGFQIYIPTSKSFLRRFLRAAQASYKSPSLELEYLANYLAELALVEYDFLKFLPSMIAASAVFLAKWTLEFSVHHPWNPTLEHYTAYKASDLKTSVVALQDLQLNTNGCPLNAIRMKYRQQKYKSVANLSSKQLLDTLF